MNRGASRAGSGASSIMVIIVCVCLTVFSVLALVTVRTEVKLTSKTTQSVTNRYAADAEAEKVLSVIDGLIAMSYNRIDLEIRIREIEGITYNVIENEIRINIKVDENNILEVILTDINPGAATDRYKINTHRQINTAQWNPDNFPVLWPGN